MKINNANCTVGIGTVSVTLNSGRVDKLKFAVGNGAETNVIEPDSNQGGLTTLQTKTYTLDTAFFPAGANTINVAGVVIAESGDEIICPTAYRTPVTC